MTADLATLVTYNPFTVSRDLPIVDVWTTMLQMGFGAVLVRDEDQQVAGLATQRLLVQRANDVGISDSVTVASCLANAPGQDAQASPRDILGRMLDHNLPALPIVEDERLVGVVSRSDFLRELSFSMLSCSGNPVVQTLHPLDDWQEPEMDWDEAIAEQNRHPHQILALGQGDRLIGVVSNKGLTRAWSCWHYRRLTHQPAPINQPTSLGLLARVSPVAPPGSSLADVARLMLEQDVDAVTVGDPTRRVLGYLTADDLLAEIRREI